MEDKSETVSLPPLSRPAVWGGVGGFLLIACAVALSTDHLLAFFSLGGLMIVVGGVMAVAFMSFGADEVNAALLAIRDMFREPITKHADMHHDIKDIIYWARIVKEKGMRGLERNMGPSADDPFVKFGLTMVVSDYTPEEIRAMMETAAEAHYERDSMPVQALQAMASHAPAFGMVGTLIGMVTMLYNLSDNPTGIGPSLAVSFLSTLYGVVTARMLYMPAAAKLTQKLDNIRFRNLLITEGMVLLASNKSAIYIQDRLNCFLSPELNGNIATLLHERAVVKLKEFRV
jgi:chemotaxis protein MotA